MSSTESIQPEKFAIEESSAVAAEGVPGEVKYQAVDESDPRLKWAFRKVDATQLFIVFLSTVLNSMDRGNLGLSKVVGLEQDTGMSGSDFNVVASIMYPTYLLFMLPSNLALRRFGARFWLSLLTVLWGVINMCMAFAKNKTDLILCRLFLGAAESGATPGALMLITLWYPRQMVTSRISLFYSAFAAGAVIGGPIATGIGKITNTHFKRWEWIFFIEGLATAGFGLIMYAFLADYPDKSWILTPEEKAIISQRMAQDQVEGGKKKVNRRRLLDHARDPLIYSQALVLFGGNFGINTILTFAAIIVKEMGYNAGASQAMQAAPGICGFVGIHLARFYPKWFGSHFRSSLFCEAWLIAGSAVLLGVTNNVARIIALCMLSFGCFGILSIGPGWLMSNVGGPTRAAISSAIEVMLGGLGALCTSYIYRNKDQPRYLFGHGMNMFAACLMVVFTYATHFILLHRNKQKETNPLDISGMSQDEINDLENDHPDFRYVH
ncbi:MFS general substrate transporter [Linderina pennispora]|uniref:MFS general substrate transporter n=1 Tax=Linderina pennispora TaxID=61395 RepID=A0A1Y1W1U2_9FUNG|nr:MFS general substrate transporter [Linderina pennispora]ORX67245.1 MFS general substrate transporter [Linderina pennispora]